MSLYTLYQEGLSPCVNVGRVMSCWQNPRCIRRWCEYLCHWGFNSVILSQVVSVCVFLAGVSEWLCDTES